MFMRTFTLLVLLLAFAGCDETGQMIKPVLVSELTEPTSSFVVVDGKELPVFDTFEQALMHDTTQFMNETVPQFFENYCRFDLWHAASHEKYNPLGRDGNPFNYLEHIIVFSDPYERYKMIKYFDDMEDSQWVDSFKHVGRSSAVGSHLNYRNMRWKILERNFTDAVPTDYRDDSKYPSYTYEPFENPYTGEVTIPTPMMWVQIDGKDLLMKRGGELVDFEDKPAPYEDENIANILMLVVAYHPLADKDSEECRKFKDSQRYRDDETALIEYNKEAIKPTPIIHDPDTRWQELIDVNGGQEDFMESDAMRKHGHFGIWRIESGIDAWNHEATQLWLNEYFKYYCTSGYASWAREYTANFTNQQARDEFLQLLIGADLQGGLSEYLTPGATAFTYSTRSGGRELKTALRLRIDNIYTSEHGCKKAVVDPEWDVIVVGQE